MKCEYHVWCDLYIDKQCVDEVRIVGTSTIPYNPPKGHEIYITEDMFTVINTSWDDGRQMLEIHINGGDTYSDRAAFEANIQAWETYGWTIERNP